MTWRRFSWTLAGTELGQKGPQHLSHQQWYLEPGRGQWPFSVLFPFDMSSEQGLSGTARGNLEQSSQDSCQDQLRPW